MATSEQNPDAPPEKDNEDENEEKLEQQELKYYLTNHEVTYKIVTTKWGRFCLVSGIIYLYHLAWSMAGCNMYSDWSRLVTCGEFKKTNSLATEKDRENSSAVYDNAIQVAVIYHIIEWVRWTLFLTSALVNVNLIRVFNYMAINWFILLIAFGWAIAARFTGNGIDCAEEGAQKTRGLYLALQMLVFGMSFFFTYGAHIFMAVMGKEWCHEQFIAEEEDD
jgi:hypothetical protein